MDTRWKHPFTCCLCGPTGCGKTWFVKRFFANLPQMCRDVRFDRILYYYAEWQDTYKELRAPRDESSDIAIEFREGLPQESDYSYDKTKAKLLVLDDLMRESAACDVILDLFTKGSHHKNISVIFISQNVFHKGKSQRDISLNTQYLVLFKNPRDKAQIRHLAQQVCPENPKILQEAYVDATCNAHSYLLLDLTQTALDEYRFRTNIFPDDLEPCCVYVAKNFKYNN